MIEMFAMDRFFDLISQHIPVVLLVIMILYIIAMVMSRVYSKYNKIKVDSGLTGTQVAERILQSSRLMASDSASVKIVSIDNYTADYSCQNNKLITLDNQLSESSSITAIGLVAHECGHAIQYAERFVPYRVYLKLLLGMLIIRVLAVIMIVLGIIIRVVFNEFSISNEFVGGIFLIALLLYAVVVLFYLLMLPMEINASKRAFSVLKESVHLSNQEMLDIKKILSVAAIYAFISALLPIRHYRGGQRVINYD